MKKIVIILFLSLISFSYQDGCKANKWTGSQIPESIIKKVLHDMNIKRQVLANGNLEALNKNKMPKSSNMNKIYWNKDLEKKAQDWANKLTENCEFKHNPDKTYGNNKNNKAGENLYISANSKIIQMNNENMASSFLKADKAWWDEKKFYSPNNVNPFKFGMNVGHFTQMAWANTMEIGCGYSLYEDSRFASNEIVVCNYAPAGNFMGEALYKQGKPCSECSQGKTCCEVYAGLCASGSGIYINTDSSDSIPDKSESEAKPEPTDDTESFGYLKFENLKGFILLIIGILLF